jgi:hypothetical protein
MDMNGWLVIAGTREVRCNMGGQPRRIGVMRIWFGSMQGGEPQWWMHGVDMEHSGIFEFAMRDMQGVTCA